MLFSLISRKVFHNLAIPVLLLNMMAAAVFVVSVIQGRHIAAFLLASFTWVLATIMSGSLTIILNPNTAILGRNLISRVLLLASVIVWAFDAPNTLLFITTATFLLLSILSEPVVKNILRTTHSRTANFPESYEASSPKFAAYLSLIHYIALAVLLITAIAWISPIILFIFIGTVLGLQALWIAIALLEIRRRHHHPVSVQITRYAPQFLVYWEAPFGASYQVSMWLPYLERAGARFILVTRSQTNFNELKQITDTPIVLRQTLAELDDVVVPSVNAVFYVNNAARNSQMVRYYNLTHIQLLHGDSDKASSYNPVLRMYDFQFVAGQAAIDRFSRHQIKMPLEMFRIVGRPQVEAVLPATDTISNIRIPIVLYAPTWAGFFQDTNYSSLPWGLEVVKSLIARGCVVIFRPHPYTARNPELAKAREQIIEFLRVDRQRNGRHHLFGDAAETTMSIFDCFNQSHAMISDVSAVVGDYLFSGKPYALTNISHTVEEFLTKFPMSQGSYLWCPPDDLTEILDALLGSDPLQAQRIKLRDYYLGNFPIEGYSENFVQAVREVIGVQTQDSSAAKNSMIHEPALEPTLDLEAP